MIKTTSQGRLELLKRFATWRSFSTEASAEILEREAATRDIVKGVAPVFQLSPVRERAKSEPRNTVSPIKEADVTMQCLQEVQDGTATHHILQDRKARKQREAIEMARSLQQPAPITEEQAREELKLQAERAEKMQQASEMMSV